MLPTDKLSPIGPLPEGSYIPLAANLHFVGRSRELLHLAERMTWAETGLKHGEGSVFFISGPAGVGKSRLAAEFVHSYGRFFPGGAQWVSLADPASAAAGVASCGLWMALDRRYAALSLAEQVALVKQAWAGPQPRLLVFDNCDDEALLAEWLPTTGGSRALVVGRQVGPQPGPDGRSLPLQPLERPDSLVMLNRFASWVKKAEADEIAAELEDWPLALHLAGNCLSLYAGLREAGEYLAKLRQAAGEKDPAARAFAASYPEVGAANTVARNLLARLACLAPDEPVPQSLVVAVMSGAPAEGTRPMAAKTVVAALRHLSRLGLVELGERRVGIGEEFIPDFQSPVLLHRRVGELVARSLDLDLVRPEVEAAVAGQARRVNAGGLTTPLLAWVVHLRAVTEEAEKRGSETAALLREQLEKL